MSESYVMPIRAIKNILKQEIKTFHDSIMSVDKIRYSNDATQALIKAGYDSLLSKLDYCIDYDSLDDFIGYHYRMSLSEWINSL